MADVVKVSLTVKQWGKEAGCFPGRKQRDFSPLMTVLLSLSYRRLAVKIILTYWAASRVDLPLLLGGSRPVKPD